MPANPQNIAGRLFFNPINIKTMGENQHVTLRPNGGWQVKDADNENATTVPKKQNETISAATRIAKNQKSALVVHGTNGRIRDKDSYRNDPIPPINKKH